MTFRIQCSHCGNDFLVSGDPLPEVALCPECGNRTRVPRIEEFGAVEAHENGVSVYVPASGPDAEPSRGRTWIKYALIGLALVIIAGVLASWPWIQERFWQRGPQDPVERVAYSYLQALANESMEDAQRLGPIQDPPAIRSFGQLRRVRGGDQTIRGKFGPIAKLNKQIDEKYEFDAKAGRFTPRNPLGAAGETLDALHEVKEKAEKSNVFEKLGDPDPNKALDAVDDLKEVGAIFSKLADGVLSPKRILPTYPMLVKEAKPPLSDAEKELALDFGENHEIWDALLKRSFLTIRADGPFVLEKAEVEANVHDRLASLGDPPSTMRLRLIRFRLEGIDTGWKVISATRVSPDDENSNATPPNRPVGESKSHSGNTETRPEN